MSLFKRSNDIEVSISPEFDREYEPGQTPALLESIAAEDVDARSSPDWLSPRRTTALSPG